MPLDSHGLGLLEKILLPTPLENSTPPPFHKSNLHIISLFFWRFAPLTPLTVALLTISLTVNGCCNFSVNAVNKI